MEICGIYTVHKDEKIADNFSYPVHSHTSHEILVVTKGNCGIVIGDTEYELGGSDAAFIFENEAHGLLIHEAPFEFYAVQFVPKAYKSAELDGMLSGLVRLCKNKSGAVLTVDETVCPTVVSCMRRICDERSDTDTDMYFTYIRAILYELGHNAVRTSGIAFEHKSKKNSGAELLNSVIDYIGDNLNMISDLSFISFASFSSSKSKTIVLPSVFPPLLWVILSGILTVMVNLTAPFSCSLPDSCGLTVALKVYTE